MGSVYKVCDGELVYYGSTRQPLCKRLWEHKKRAENKCVTKNMNRDNLTIELVEEVEDAEQLLWRERYYIENNECVNKNSAIQTKQERNKYLRTLAKKPYTCECGSTIQIGGKLRHLESKKHILYCDTI